MKEISLWEMLQTLGNLVLSSPVFVMTLLIGILLLSLAFISIHKNKKIGKVLSICIWAFLIIFILIRYNHYLYNLLDNLMNTIFVQIFFPNLATYIIVLLVTNFIEIYTIFKKNIADSLKYLNSIFAFIIMFLFLITIEKVVTNNIDIYEPLTVYSNKEVLILIELSMLIFTCWMFVLFSIKIIKILIQKSEHKKIFQEDMPAINKLLDECINNINDLGFQAIADKHDLEKQYQITFKVTK